MRPTEDRLFGIYRNWEASGLPSVNLATALNRAWGEAWDSEEAEESIWHAFHRAWTACVGTKRYDKAPWRECAKQVGDVVGPAERDLPSADDVAGTPGKPDEDVGRFNAEQRIRREAYAAALTECGYIGTGGPVDRAASRYPLRKRVPKAIHDPHGLGEWRIGPGDLFQILAGKGARWRDANTGIYWSHERVRVLAALLDNSWTWEDDTSPETAPLP